MTRILNISNRLPVTVAEQITRSSGGLVAGLEGAAEEGYGLKWIGWPGKAIVEPDRQQEIQRVLEREYNCTPVFLEPEVEQGFYEGYSNSTLWPILHYMPGRMRYDPIWWRQYRAANERFAEVVLAAAREDDLVWVHDYHLMLLPGLLKEAMPSLRIGFFLHTPFPSYEVFRCLPHREELAAGLLGADQVGFHTYGYMRHFRSAVLRLLGIESELTHIRHDERSTYLGVYPIGIHAPKFEAELQSPEFARQRAETAEAHRGKKMVLSVERLDYTKGLLHRLDAIDRFLADFEDREKLQFIFISVPSRENVEEYQTLREEMERQIGRINGKYATLSNSPILFKHGSVNFTELCALYSIADVALVTPLIDGMNLVAKEYVACQGEQPGALVLSEFAGAAEELSSALVVNPYDTEALANCLREALSMNEPERRQRMEPMRQRVMKVDARAWARSFLRDLSSRLPAAEARSEIDQAKVQLIEAMNAGRRLAMFLDYDGTLRELERDPGAAWPGPAVRALLDRLRERPNVEVTIISGRRAEDLENFLGEYPFGMIAEHGAMLRRPGQREWEVLDRSIDYSWKEPLRRVLRQFADSTPGTFVEEKRSGLVWHYRKSDPEFGAWKASLLATELESMTANLPIHIRHGKKIVEISSDQVNKEAAVRRELEERGYDLALVAGDDQTDESMFRLEQPNLLTVKVGEGDTRARYRVSNPARFRRLLHEVLDLTEANTEARVR